MVNPAGYTALDMIGFTDQGAYSSSDNYVKNDLVHYSGNIWRCLIDDTSGIAPAEGVNWTLFIGEPTNLVERIIAPVETDPATNSYAVGRQFIYNDNLYEVIAAITAGDALVAYEDDPTNANIKLADPVESQLLNVKGNLSNRNLLDNAWFTVNQRGQSSYSGSSSYTVDRWKMTNSHSQVDVSDDGIVLTDTDTTASSGAYLLQLLENSTVNLLLGKTLTYSTIVDNKLLSATFVLPETIPDESTTLASLYIDEENVGSVMWLISGSSTLLYFRIMAHYGTPHTFRAAKLELGSVSTLAMDTAPNYQQELAKCQRYFYRFSGNPMFTGFTNQATNIRLSIPIQMRTIPTVTYTVGDTYPLLVYNGGTVQLTSSNTFDVGSGIVGNVLLAISGFSGLTVAHACALKLNTGTLDFSADL